MKKKSHMNQNRNALNEVLRRLIQITNDPRQLAQLRTVNRRTRQFMNRQNAVFILARNRYLRAIRNYTKGMEHPMAFEPEYGIGRMHRQGVWVKFLKAENEIRRILGLPLRNIPNFGVFSPFEPPYKPPVNQRVLRALLIRNLESTWIRRTPTGTTNR